MLLQGSLCLQRCQTFRANALICALGSVLGTPFLYLGLHLIEINMTASWVSSLNSALNSFEHMIYSS